MTSRSRGTGGLEGQSGHWIARIERQLRPDTVEKLALIAGSAADSISQLIWEIVGDDGTEEGNAGGVVLRVLA